MRDTSTPTGSRRGPRVTAPRTLDRLFRVAGAGALVALAATGAALALGVEAWRAPFVLAHLLALVALLPLGIALVVAALRAGHAERGTPTGALSAMIARFPVDTVLVVLALLGVAVTLSQFDGGVRTVRSAANVVTVGAVVALVARYLRATAAAR